MADATRAAFQLESSQPPAGFSTLRQALWWDAKGDWEKAHDLAAADSSEAAAWVHAYLHRKERDLGNARYWYSQAGKEPRTGALEAEWHELATVITA